MRVVCLVGLSALCVSATLASANAWRPDYLDLGDQVIKVGPTQIVTLTDSDPDREYEETMNKAKALAVAVEMAEKEAGQ